MNLTFINLTTFINLYISLMLVLFFSTTKYGDKFTNKIVAVLLFFFIALVFFSFSVSNWGSLYFIAYHKPLLLVYQLSFLVGPIILKYLQVFKLEKRISWVDIIHTLPFIGFVFYTLVYYSNIDNFVMWQHRIFNHIAIGILIQLVVYLFLIIRLLIRIRKKTDEQGKRVFIKNRFDLCKNILLGYIFLWVISLHVLAMYMIFINPTWCAYTASVWGYSSFSFLNTFLIVVIFKPDILLKKEKYQYSKINTGEMENYLDKINNYLVSEKAYLNSEISLGQMSSDIEINRRIISQVINEVYKTNFRNHINLLRIEHSIELISSDENQDIRISEIMYDSGFSSKTVFNNLFKEKTGMTPKEYKTSLKKGS